MGGVLIKLPKGTSLGGKTSYNRYRSSKSVHRCDLCAWQRDQKERQRKKPNSGKLCIRRDHPRCRIELKFCTVGGIRGILTSLEFHRNRLSRDATTILHEQYGKFSFTVYRKQLTNISFPNFWRFCVYWESEPETKHWICAIRKGRLRKSKVDHSFYICSLPLYTTDLCHEKIKVLRKTMSGSRGQQKQTTQEQNSLGLT